MRGAIGDIVAAGAADLSVALMNECAAVATASGFPPAGKLLDQVRAMVTQPGSSQTSSMFRDMERQGRIESDQIIGDLVRRAGDRLPAGALLRIVLAHLKSYEARRAREDAAA
jgi:2-dehydropantoate 2-reductase